MQNDLIPIPDTILVYIEVKHSNPERGWHPPLTIPRDFELVKVMDNTQQYYVPKKFNYRLFRAMKRQLAEKCFLIIIRSDCTVKYNGLGDVIEMIYVKWGQGVLDLTNPPSPTFVKYDFGDDGDVLTPCTIIFYDANENLLRGQCSWNVNHCPILNHFNGCTYNFFMFNVLKIRQNIIKKVMEGLRVVVFNGDGVVRTITYCEDSQ